MNLSEFQQKILEAGKPVVVDFWAGWCMPCRVTKLAQEYSDKVEFMSIDADVSGEVLQQFQVIGIPTVLTLRNGNVVGRVTGAQNKAGYRLMFEALAEGKEVKIPMSPFDRMLRLGAGTLLAMAGISTGSWLLAALGGLVAFLGVYDRCPIWRAFTKLISSRAMPQHLK